MRLTRATAAIVISACVASAGWASTAYADAPESTPSRLASGAKAQPASYLFSITAESGSLRRIEGKPVTYVLKLRNASDLVTWFTDRPVRDSGFMATKDFFAGWKAYGFAQDPPNVALTLRDPAGDTDTVVATMTRPSLSKGTLTATFIVLSMDQAQGLGGHLQAHGARHDLDLPTRFTSAAVFIDDVRGCGPVNSRAFRSCM